MIANFNFLYFFYVYKSNNIKPKWRQYGAGSEKNNFVDVKIYSEVPGFGSLKIISSFWSRTCQFCKTLSFSSGRRIWARLAGSVYTIQYTVRKEMNCSGNLEILHGLLHENAPISSCFSDFREVPRNICEVSRNSQIHFISIITVYRYFISVISTYLYVKIVLAHFSLGQCVLLCSLCYYSICRY